MALLFSLYMLLDPAVGLAKLMQLTPLSMSFKLFIMALATGGFLCAWIGERLVFQWLAKALSRAHHRIWRHQGKSQKEYKVLLGQMRI